MVLDERSTDLIYGSELIEEIARRTRLLAPHLTAAAVLSRPDLLAEAEVIFSGWGAPRMDEEFLAAAPKLRAVFYGAGSIRSFTTDAFWARGIAVSSAYAMNAVPVAEYTLAAILFSLKRGWHFCLETRRRGAYPPRSAVPGAYGSTVGLVSLGMIGRLVRERLRPFDVDVIAFDPFVTPEQATALDVEMVSLEEVFRRSDVVSLHTPWLKETEDMVRREHFAAMRAGATFINTARGAVVREADLIAVMAEREDLTAVLDVTWPEPPVPGSPLYSLPNVVLTPHIAGSMNRECRRMGRCMIDEFDRWARGEPTKWGITREKAALLA
jgi:phosphoglycerate dehydrogenase-like enzyme